MTHRTPSVAAKRGAPVGLVTALFATMLGANAGQAQQPTPVEPAQSSRQPIQMTFSPWAKYCTKGPVEQSAEIKAKEVCFTAADGHLATGQKLVIALLIEPEGATTRLLRVTLPLGVALVPGARIVIDEEEAMVAPYIACLPKSGCMADYKADAGLIERFKRGRSLAIQAFDKGKPISFTLPLTGFAKAYDGPPGDPGVLKELSNEMQPDDRLDATDGR